MELKRIQIIDIEKNTIRKYNHISSMFCLFFMPLLSKEVQLENTRKLNFHITDIKEPFFHSYGKSLSCISELHFNFPDSEIQNRKDYLVRIYQILEVGFYELSKIEQINLSLIQKILLNIKTNDFIFTLDGKLKGNRKGVKSFPTLKYDLVEYKLTLIHNFIFSNNETKQEVIFEANYDDAYSNFLFNSSKWINAKEYCTFSRSKEILFITNIETQESRIEYNPQINSLEKLEKEIFLTGFGNRIVGDWQEEQSMEMDRINFNDYTPVKFLSAD